MEGALEDSHVSQTQCQTDDDVSCWRKERQFGWFGGDEVRRSKQCYGYGGYLAR